MYISKRKRLRINYLSAHIKKQGGKKPASRTQSGRKQIINIKTYIRDLENKCVMEKLTELKASSLKRLNIDKPLSRLTRVDHMPYFQYLSYKANKLLNIFYPPTLRDTPSHNREGSMSEVTNYLELCAGKWGDGGWCLPPPLLPLWHHLIP